MSGKTLSTSTLSLRFMQNAHRAKLMKEVEPEKAQVHDDAQWDVGQEVREAWGLVSGQNASQTITHEASYLPFLFFDGSVDATPESNPGPPQLPKGRRKFNSRAQEETVTGKQEQEEQEEPEPEPPTGRPQQLKEKKSRSRVHPHPIPIQSVSGKLISGLPMLKTPKESKSAREAIFDNSGVGIDLRAAAAAAVSTKPPKPDGTDPTASAKGFLKPSGIDAPPDTSKINRFDLMDGAREKKQKKPKRNREGSVNSEVKEEKRQKKKQAT